MDNPDPTTVDWDDLHDTSGMYGYRPDPTRCRTTVSPYGPGQDWRQCAFAPRHSGPCFVGTFSTSTPNRVAP